jgi:hypothetical protein
VLQKAAEVLLIGFFAVWFVISVLCLLPSLRDHIRRRDVLTLIPEWKFFAPNPGQWDYHLVYRDQLPGGILTDWTEVAEVTPRAWWNAVWNPAKRGNKALADCVVVMAKHIVAEDGVIEASVPYLTLLNYISSLPRLGRTEYTQFALIQFHARGSREEPELLFVSALHSL